MQDNLHPVTKLLIARMESHPEEFKHYVGSSYIPSGRWTTAITIVRENGSDADQAALKTALDSVLMDEAHEWMLDELLNGDERRAEHGRMQAAAYNTRVMQQAAQSQAQLYNNQYANSVGLGTTTPATVLGVSTTHADGSLVRKIKTGLGLP